ncbi:MAG: hypothetical protein U9Q21_00310, partial [Candidatus Auribacterota bacterium]|nr:hypothetical protein [Candidatus Auribacterota bacterium]
PKPVSEPIKKLPKLEPTKKAKVRVANVTKMPRGEEFTMVGKPKTIGVSAKEQIRRELEQVRRKKEWAGKAARDIKIKDIVSLPDSTLTKLKFKPQTIGIKAGLEVGKAVGKEKLTAYKAKLSEKMRIQRALKSVFKKYRHPEKSVDFATLKEIESIQSKMAITKPSQLGETTIDELESLAYKVAKLRKKGRQMFFKKRKIRGLKHNNTKRELLSTMRGGKPPPTITPKIENKETFGAKMRGVNTRVLRPTRVFDYLDGAKDYNGKHSQFFYNKADQATNNKIKSLFDRRDRLKEMVKKLPKKWQAETKTINGIEFTNSQRIYLYYASQNSEQQAAVMYGNRLSPKTIKAVADSIKNNPAEKEFADGFRKLVGEKVEELRKTLIDWENHDMGKVENYFPMMRNKDFLSFEEEMAEEMLFRGAIRGGRVEKGMTISRERIPKEYQTPVNMDALGVGLRAIERQEHLINFLPLQKQWKRMIGDPEYKQALMDKIGRGGFKVIEKWIDHNLNPQLVYSANEPILTALRKNVSVAYLAYNLSTMGKQFPSIAFALQSSNVGDIAKGIQETITNYKATRDFVYARDPQVRNRKIERDIEELKRGKHGNKFMRIRQKVGEGGFAGIFAIDHVVVLSTWKAVYSNAIKQGLSEEEAIAKAHKAFINTQPQAAAKDLPDIYRSGEALRMLTQFTNQLNQIYNMITYEIPMYAKKDPRKVFATIISLLTSSGMIWGMQNKKAPQNTKEVLEALLGSGLQSVPLVGSPLYMALSGKPYGTEINVPSLRLVGAATGVITSKKPETKIKRLAEAAALTLGVPYIQPKRIIQKLQKEKTRSPWTTAKKSGSSDKDWSKAKE